MKSKEHTFKSVLTLQQNTKKTQQLFTASKRITSMLNLEVSKRLSFKLPMQFQAQDLVLDAKVLKPTLRDFNNLKKSQTALRVLKKHMPFKREEKSELSLNLKKYQTTTQCSLQKTSLKRLKTRCNILAKSKSMLSENLVSAKQQNNFNPALCLT